MIRLRFGYDQVQDQIIIGLCQDQDQGMIRLGQDQFRTRLGLGLRQDIFVLGLGQDQVRIGLGQDKIMFRIRIMLALGYHQCRIGLCQGWAQDQKLYHQVRNRQGTFSKWQDQVRLGCERQIKCQVFALKNCSGSISVPD